MSGWKTIATDSGYAMEKLEEVGVLCPLDCKTTARYLKATWSFLILYFAFQGRAAYILGHHLPWLLLVEISFLLPRIATACDMFSYLLFAAKGKHRGRYRLTGSTAPLIDVVITCCGEDVDVIMDSAVGAASQDYPSDCFRVFILDDGQSNALRTAVAQYNLRTKSKEITYLARSKPEGKPHYFKAGNLAFGLAETDRRGGTEYFASLDADMIPEPDWLRRTVPHLILDPSLALVNPAQRFYNVPPDDILGQGGQTHSVINDFLGPMTDDLGTVQCFGTGYIVRRAALKEIGGYPQVNVGEDVFCSHVLAGHGWGIAFLRENVQTGLAAGSFQAVLKQHMRWTNGCYQLARSFNYFLPWIDPLPRRTWPQSLAMFTYTLRVYTHITDTIAMLLLPYLLWNADPPIADGPFQCYLLPKALYLVSYFVDRRANRLIFAQFAASKGARFWVSPFNAAQVIKSMLWPSDMTFEPTGTILSRANERSSRDRQPLLTRLLAPVILAYIIYILVATLSLLSFFAKVILYRQHNSALVFSSYTAAVIIQVQIIMQMILPVQYMIWPPTSPERRDLMLEDDSGVRRPKVNYMDVDRVKSAGGSARRTVLGYSCLEISYLSVILFVGWFGL